MSQSRSIAVSPAPTLGNRIDEVALDKELP
jgi:hypothetical protein